MFCVWIPVLLDFSVNTFYDVLFGDFFGASTLVFFVLILTFVF